MNHHATVALNTCHLDNLKRRGQAAAYDLPRPSPAFAEMAQALRPELRILLLCLFLVNFGYFMVLPMLAVYLVTALHFTAGQVGLIMAVALGVQKALSLPAGYLTDRSNQRSILLLGLGLRVVGFTLFAFASSFSFILLAATLSAVGGALLGPPIKARLASEQDPGVRKPLFALRQVASNLGVVMAPIFASLVLLIDVRAGFVFAALLHLTGLLLARTSIRFRPKPTRPPGMKSAVAILATREFLLFLAGVTGVLALFSQFNVTLPLRVAYLMTADGQSVEAARAMAALLLTINAVSIIVGQALLIKWVIHQNATRLFQSGALLISVGLVICLSASALPGIWLGIVIFSVGEIMLFPAIDEIVTEHAPAQLIATVYGFTAMAWAVGGSLGNFFGPVLADPTRLPGMLLNLGLLGVGGLTILLVQMSATSSRRAQEIHVNPAD